jgi:hypothetical protein
MTRLKSAPGRRTILITAALIHLFAACGKPEDPSEADGTQTVLSERNFAKIMRDHSQGKVTRLPWAGFYWPYVKDGIASTEFSANSGSRFFPRRESPTAKYDRAHSSHTSADTWEKNNHGRKVRGVEGWWGHCNGWSTAAALFPEPKKPVRVGGVEFGVGDIKALLSEASMESQADFFGTRVDSKSDYSTYKYQDVAPDQYLLVLANYIGKLGKPVLIDRHTGDEVWNQPLAGYRIEPVTRADYLGAAPEHPGVYRVTVTSTIWWLRDDVRPDFVTPPFEFKDGEGFQSRTLKMEVWLDGPVGFDFLGQMQSSGDVIVVHQDDQALGGDWRMGNGHVNDAWPDYMWVPNSVTPSTGYSNPELNLDWLQKNLL